MSFFLDLKSAGSYILLLSRFLNILRRLRKQVALEERTQQLVEVGV